ncbi:hypothetical protein COU97_01380 [Candidatus Shapirobacteria bacterium CG10_big_fil_rev_8_21_14_0_10_48_15]|uniref:Uncharacterized protein n=1 Tax=Candidatus Shapirobacteria bacterium CG10_big_fil_rev_8_21_14_0_10_48_15 TaxID=1974484 RepID=A0A2M8L7B5_9BACT|nr:MAG: hypothetical protein COU97_01380 [Candidatus Shapirobacteria bacterium CG10_big_fil_rev_8_21_14_0_10_48_15]
MKLQKPNWAPFLPLIIAALAFIFLASLLSTQNKGKSRADSSVLPQPASQSSFVLAVRQATGQQTDLELKLTSPLADVSGFSLRLDFQGSATQLKASPELEKEGWVFPIQKISPNRVEFSGIYPKLQKYSFQAEKVIASFTVNGAFDSLSFKLDPQVTKLISKTNEVLTPILTWEKI